MSGFFFLDFLNSFDSFLIYWCVVSVIFYLPIKADPVKSEKVEKEEPVTEVSILSLTPFLFQLSYSICTFKTLL